MNSNIEKLSKNICPICGEEGTLVSEMIGLSYYKWSIEKKCFECYSFDKNDFEKIGDVFCNSCGSSFDKDGNIIKGGVFNE